jgi:heme/copper-type cytochrome/quinol oxidase subunit 2
VEYQQENAGFLQEFREFIGVRTAFLGFLAISSVFLPLSNLHFQVLPLEPYGIDSGVLNILSPTLITVIATIVAFIAVVSIFSMRTSYRGRGKRDARRKALTSITVTMITLIAYLLIRLIYSKYIASVSYIGSSDPRKLYFDVPLLLAYATFFSHLTQTLMLVAMSKFYRQNQLQSLKDNTSPD